MNSEEKNNRIEGYEDYEDYMLMDSISKRSPFYNLNKSVERKYNKNCKEEEKYNKKSDESSDNCEVTESNNSTKSNVNQNDKEEKENNKKSIESSNRYKATGLHNNTRINGNKNHKGEEHNKKSGKKINTNKLVELLLQYINNNKINPLTIMSLDENIYSKSNLEGVNVLDGLLSNMLMSDYKLNESNNNSIGEIIKLMNGGISKMEPDYGNEKSNKNNEDINENLKRILESVNIDELKQEVEGKSMEEIIEMAKKVSSSINFDNRQNEENKSNVNNDVSDILEDADINKLKQEVEGKSMEEIVEMAKKIASNIDFDDVQNDKSKPNMNNDISNILEDIDINKLKQEVEGKSMEEIMGMIKKISKK
ncbi:hypothetical protein [Romboutsia sp. 1001216sp1]|uniref:hypothetical protein n=1 Tax=Romboutsia sp. 1001216sp1 TaxID=2986997 RepID=UPI00232EF28D|nr:hypothetical protein [Romboutsia sp. 1001216sp1]MDB8803800.1 hypothetical protein [Romboutsia sp. 1001216sp1]MDB8806850.1 hypothetical protein [Romboutsia sp. 1001216sp1]MDB8809447.1 hypothetical protein [Romboutsia sp. 1001216sp1]MDB8815196.1 hypothetical protein [Romboutsia sp. 1001216sp1]MDB8817889.1 hypothetical protein [Romboutsia sp. 1001216sp1]